MPTAWQAAAQYTDIRYEKGSGEDAGIAKVTINRPEVHNAFRPETVVELSDAFEKARNAEAGLQWQTARENTTAQALYERVGGIREEWYDYYLEA